MARKRYSNKECGYCGNNTGPNGEGEHVLPACFYPECTDPKIQILKIPSCPKCNDSWQKDEAHCRSVLVACGLAVTSERRQVWANSLRSFDNPISGRGDVRAVAATLVPSPILNEYGQPYQRIFPCNDPRVVRVLKKIVRGLAYHCWKKVIADERVNIRVPPYPLLPTSYDDLSTIYEVPHVFKSRACFLGEDDLHSVWILDFFDNVRIIGSIT
jgi:hypothetical protein